MFFNRKLCGRQKFGKIKTSDRVNCYLEGVVKQNLFKSLRFTRNGLRRESPHQEHLRTDESYTNANLTFLMSSHFRTSKNVGSLIPGIIRTRIELLLSGSKFYFQLECFNFFWKSGSESLEKEGSTRISIAVTLE